MKYGIRNRSLNMEWKDALMAAGEIGYDIKDKGGNLLGEGEVNWDRGHQRDRLRRLAGSGDQTDQSSTQSRCGKPEVHTGCYPEGSLGKF